MSGAVKGGYGDHNKDMESRPGSHFEDITPSRVRVTPTPIYSSGVTIAINKDSADVFPDLILSEVDQPTVVIDGLVSGNKRRR